MIKLKNQWCLSLKIGDIEDFIHPADFEYLEIKENAGGLRPILEIGFTLMEEKVIALLNQGNPLRLQYGITELQSPIYEFEICGDTTLPQYSAGSRVVLECAMRKPKFTNKARRYTYQNKYSYECVSAIAKSHGFNFNVNTTNITKTNDKCNWYQCGQTDWELLEELCSSAYINDDTFISWGFDCNNIYMYDVKKQLSNGPKWIFSVADTAMTDNIINITTYVPTGQYQGQNSSLAGKNLTVVDYNLDSGEMTYPKHSLKSLTTLNTNKINVNSQNCEDYSYHVSTDAKHPNYVTATNNNLRNNILFSSYCVNVPIVNLYRDFHLLDIVQLKPYEEDSASAGFYWITAINRYISDNKVGYIITLNRESAGIMVGKNLDESGS